MDFVGLESTRLHSVSLNHKDLRLKWVVNWNQNEVMFNIDNALIADYKWFAFGFSNRGEWNRSDLSFFAHNNGQYDPPIVSRILYYIHFKLFEYKYDLLYTGHLHDRRYRL